MAVAKRLSNGKPVVDAAGHSPFYWSSPNPCDGVLQLRFAPIAAVALFGALPASAAWQRASSPHFIIYADESPAKLKAFAEKLERFDQAVRVTRSEIAPRNQ